MNASRTEAARTAGLTLAALLAFAANSLLCRAALGPRLLDPATFTTVRIASGAVVLTFLARIGPAQARAARGDGNWISAFALFAYALAFSLAYVRIGAGVGAFVLFGTVQITMVSWGLRRGERPSAGEWGGLALAIAGLGWFMLPGAHAPDPFGASLMVAAGVAWGVYSLRGRQSSRPLLTTAANFVRAVPFAIGASAMALLQWHASLRGVLLAVASGALASGLGYCVWYLALPRLTATRAALVQLVVPVIAVVGAVALLGEKITSRLVGGGSIVVIGVLMAVTSKARGRKG
jgi:drug/metabolite transporter (DMT)-like permease